MQKSSESKLVAVATRTGAAVQTAANRPVELNDPEFVWFVESGAVDVFLTESKHETAVAAPQHLLAVEEGGLLLGAPEGEGEPNFKFIAKGLIDTTLRKVPAKSLAEANAPEVAKHVDRWILGISSALAKAAESRPNPDSQVGAGLDAEIEPGTLSVEKGGVVWVEGLTSGNSLFMDISQLSSDAAAGAIPLTPDSWINLLDSAKIGTSSSRDLFLKDALFEYTARFHSLVCDTMRLSRFLAVADDANLQREQAELRRSDESRAKFDLYNILNTSLESIPGSDLLSVLTLIGRFEGIAFNEPEDPTDRKMSYTLSDIIDVSGLRRRRIRLRREEKWWIGDCGALLGFRKEDAQPVALIPDALGRYYEIDPSWTSRRRVTEDHAAELERTAFMFYRPLPSGKAGPGDLGRLAISRTGKNFAMFLTVGLLGGLLLLMPAVVVGLIGNQIVPVGDSALLYQAVVLLVALALLGAFMEMWRGALLMKLEGSIVARVEAALWDRMMRLPSSFMGRHPVGDLALRVAAFRALRDALSGVVANAMISVIFLFPAFGLMIYQDAALGGIAAAFGVVSLAMLSWLAWRQVPHHRRVVTANRRLSGLLFQFLNGAVKLRAGSAEASAFARWANEYLSQKKGEIGIGILNEHLVAFSFTFPILASAFVIVNSSPDMISIGDFLVIFTAFAVFQAAVLRLGASLSAVVAILPACEVVYPILAEEPEGTSKGEAVEKLDGDIRFDHISFRYDSEGPLILDDVSIHAAPGEFVAITGESGTGKSTLFRIALGIESPSTGAVYFDGRDMKSLNLKQLRNWIGAVPQKTVMVPDDIWDNISAGSEMITLSEAWDAARLACVDREIERMPMGMSTSVGKSATTLSGGESQRVRIAAALAKKPKLIFLDESTNWLDNESQSQVMDSVMSLPATKLVIAHRLSTLKGADRIYVMDGGKIVQVGTYHELSEVEGLFRSLVRRQSA